MTPDELRIQAQLICSTPIDKAVAFGWVKDEIQNIASEYFKAGKYVTEKFETKENFEIYETKREMLVLDMLIVDRTRRRTSDFDFHNGVITVSIPDKYEVRYYSYPDAPETEYSEIDMPKQYVMPIKYYLAARIRARLFGQNDANAVSFMTEYMDKLKKADITYNVRKGRHGRMPPGRRDI